MLRKTTLTILLLGVVFTAISQSYNVRNYSVNDGLAQNYVAIMLEDSEGYLWFGTMDGLCRFDGYEFTVFRNIPGDTTSIADGDVTALHEDSQGFIWIVMRDGDIDVYDRRNQSFFHLSSIPGFPEKHMITEAYEIGEDKSGDIWIENAQYVLHIQNEWSGHKSWLEEDIAITFFNTKVDTLSSRPNLYGLEPSLNLWAHTRDALLKIDSFDHVKGKLHYQTYPEISKKIDFIQPVRLYESRDDKVWLWNGEGYLYAIDLTDSNVELLDRKLEYVRFVGESEEEVFIFNTLGITGVNKTTIEARNAGPNIPDMSCFSVDTNGVFWFISAGFGVSVATKMKIESLTMLPVIEKPFSTRGLLKDKEGEVWIRSGFYYYNWNRETNGLDSLIRRVLGDEPLKEGTSPTIMEDEEGKIWFARDTVVYWFDRNTRDIRRYKMGLRWPKEEYNVRTHVGTFFEDEEKNIWVSTPVALSRLNRHSGEFTHYYFPDSVGYTSGIAWPPLSIQKDAHGFLWTGGYKSLYRLNPVTGKIIAFKPGNTASQQEDNATILSLCLDPFQPDKILWLATPKGLIKFYLPIEPAEIANPRYKIYTTADGLPNNHVYAVLDDSEGNLWLSTNNGLSKFNPQTEIFKNYTVDEGLQHEEFNTASFHKARDGELFFGGIKGINFFYPEKLRDNPHIPPIVLTEFRINNQKVDFKSPDATISKPIEQIENITLDYTQNMLTFKFAALDFFNPDKNQYRYKLEGLQDNWIENGNNRTAVFTNLDPGNYVFKVMGSNNDGVWNPEPRVVNIRITPPWWQTNLAYAIYVLLILTALYIIYRVRENRLKLKHGLELERQQSETLMEMDELKSRFFANISHEFRTPLTVIQGYIEEVEKSVDEEKLKRHLQTALRNSDSLLRLVNQLLELSRFESGKMKVNLENDDIISFIRVATYSFESKAGEKQIDLHFNSEINTLETEFDKDKLEKIINNLLSNAIKFTEDGMVNVKCLVINDHHELNIKHLTLIIKDSGIGISSDQLPHIFDRFYQVDSSTTRAYEGTGIGLALTKNLVEILGGKISVKSEVGKGTEFRVELPLNIDSNSEVKPSVVITPSVPLAPQNGQPAGGRASHAGQAEAHNQGGRNFLKLATAESSSEGGQVSPAGGPVQSEGRFRGVTKSIGKPPISNSKEQTNHESTNNQILIIEDNPDVRTYIRESIEENHQVIEASDGQEGIEKAIEHIPDLIISDVMMPRKDGFEVCQTLKNNDKTSHIPIILLTAKAGVENRISGWQTGADDYLVKPFNVTELKIRIDNLITLRKALQKKYSRFLAPETAHISVNNRDEEFLQNISKLIRENMDNEDFGISDIYPKVGMSRTQFYRKFSALTGNSPAHFIKNTKLEHAMHLLKTTDMRVAEVAFSCGFSRPNNFTAAFTAHFKMAPSEVQNPKV